MVYHICQIWGDNRRLVLAAFDNRDEVDEFLLKAKADGTLHLWGKVEIIEIEGIARFSPAQWLRSRRVYETVDGLSPGRHRPEYGNEYVRSVYEKDDHGLMRYDHEPNTLETDEFPQDHLDPPVGPNWHIRSQIRDFQDGMTADEWQADEERRAADRLSLPTSDALALQRAIDKLARQVEPGRTAPQLGPAPSVQQQLDAIHAAESRESHPRGGKLPNGRGYIDPTQ